MHYVEEWGIRLMARRELEREQRQAISQSPYVEIHFKIHFPREAKDRRIHVTAIFTTLDSEIDSIFSLTLYRNTSADASTFPVI